MLQPCPPAPTGERRRESACHTQRWVARGMREASRTAPYELKVAATARHNPHGPIPTTREASDPPQACAARRPTPGQRVRNVARKSCPDRASQPTPRNPQALPGRRRTVPPETPQTARRPRQLHPRPRAPAAPTRREKHGESGPDRASADQMRHTRQKRTECRCSRGHRSGAPTAETRKPGNQVRPARNMQAKF